MKSFEESLNASLRELIGEKQPPPPPRRITISVPGELYERVEDMAKRLGESWSTASVTLIREALPYAEAFLERENVRRASTFLIDGPVIDSGVAEDGTPTERRIVLALSVGAEMAKELLMNPQMADADPEAYKQARWLQAAGYLEPEFPPEDPSRVEEIRRSNFAQYEGLNREQLDRISEYTREHNVSFADARAVVLGENA